jgi:hypothetical protein
MKILIIQENGRHDKNRHFRECFCMQRALQSLGNVVDIWGLGHESYNTIPDFEKYDAIINLENYDSIGWVPNLKSVKNPKKILWSIDAHCRGLKPFLDTYNNGDYDLILQATEDFVNTKEKSVWFPNCYDDTLLKKLNVKKSIDLGFCGSMLNRAGLLEYLETKYNLQKNIFVIGNDMVEKVNSFWINFNINLANDINYRSFETIGCGTVLITNYNPQYEKLGFIDEHNCLMYKTMQELEGKLKKYIRQYDKLENIITNGTELAKEHTFLKRAQEVTKLIEEL